MDKSEPRQHRTANIRQEQIAKVYAEALLGSAASATDGQAPVNELGRLLDELFSQVPHFEELLGSPRISTDEKGRLIDKLLQEHVSKNLLHFLHVVNNHERLDCLRAIYDRAYSLMNARHGVIEVEMFTAQPADDGMKQKVKAALTDKLHTSVDLRTATDPSLIGGVLVRVGDKVLDASIKRKLGLMRDQAIAAASRDIRAHSERFAS